MIQAYKNYWLNYANFKDRTSVSGYWWCVLANFLVSFVLGIIIGLIMGSMGVETVKLAEDGSNYAEYLRSPDMIVSLVWGLINFIPGLAIFARRMHDTNRSGWLYLLLLIPLVNLVAVFVLLVFLCGSSVNEGNKYGSNQV